MLTGKELFESGFITDALEQNVQQQGIDIRVRAIYDLSGLGVIPAEGKTTKPNSTPIKPGLNGLWTLNAGYYEVEFEEGCNLPNNIGAQLKSRSSLVRCGGDIRSGHFDPGFNTKHMGGYMKLERPIQIEPGACLAQVITFVSNEVENTYNGQWQGDKQRETNN